jgi:hypothetical protein
LKRTHGFTARSVEKYGIIEKKINQHRKNMGKRFGANQEIETGCDENDAVLAEPGICNERTKKRKQGGSSIPCIYGGGCCSC